MPTKYIQQSDLPAKADLLKPVSEALDNLLTSIPTITQQVAALKDVSVEVPHDVTAADQLDRYIGTDLRPLIRRTKDLMSPIKAKLRAPWKKACEVEKRLLTFLEGLESKGNASLAQWHRNEAARKQREREREERLIQQQVELELEAQLEKAMGEGDIDLVNQIVGEAADSSEQVELAMSSMAPPVVAKPVTLTHTSIRDTWDFEVLNAEYLLPAFRKVVPDRVSIRRVVVEHGKGAVHMVSEQGGPAIRVFADSKLRRK